MYLQLVTDRSEDLAASISPFEATLLDLLDLSLQAEQAHRCLAGPGARGIHLCLEQLVDQYRDWHEEIVDRLRALGATPVGRIGALAAERPIELLPAGRLPDRQVVSFFVTRIEFLVRRVRVRGAALGDWDPAGRSLLLAIEAWLETQAVFLRAQPSYRGRQTAPQSMSTIGPFPRIA
jgi:starvation-inducible DNA-binding protein